MRDKVFITKLYDEYVGETMKPSAEYLKIAKKFSDSVEKLAKGLSEEKNDQLNIMYDYMNEMIEKQCKETFVEGYCLGANLTLEALDNSNRNKKRNNKNKYNIDNIVLIYYYNDRLFIRENIIW